MTWLTVITGKLMSKKPKIKRKAIIKEEVLTKYDVLFKNALEKVTIIEIPELPEVPVSVANDWEFGSFM